MHKWTRLDSAIDKAARDHYYEEEKIINELQLFPRNRFGEHIGAFSDGVRWAMKHHRMLGFIKKK